MFSTSLAAAAFGGLLMVPNLATQPVWQSDYRQALTQAADQHKPLAVFINSGGTGYARLIQDGSIPKEAAEVLKKNYVCLYVDVLTTTGKELSGSFQMSEGIVISDPTAGLQALRHAGPIEATELTRYVQQYAEPTTPLARTNYSGVDSTPFVQPAIVSYQPAYQQPRPVMNMLNNVRNFIAPAST